MARSVDKEEFAIYVLLLSIVSIVIGFQKALITTPFSILYGSFRNKIKKQYFITTVYFQIIFFVFTSILCLLYYFTNPSDITEISYQYFMWCILFLIGQQLLSFFKHIFIAQLNTLTNFLFCILIYIPVISSLLFLYYLNDLDVSSVFIITGSICIIISLLYFGFYTIPELQKNNLKFQRSFLKRNYNLGKWLAGTNVVFFFTSQIFPWLLLFFWNKEYVAEMAVVLSITRILAPLMTGISAYLLPKLVREFKNIENFKNIIIKLLMGMLVVAVFLITFGYWFGEIFIVLLYSDTYSGLSVLIILACFYQSIHIISLPIDAGLNALKRTDLGFKTLLISGIVAVLFGIPLTLYYDVAGALISMILSAFTSLVFRFIALFKILDLN
ncbi:MAG: hypothetical protein OCD03_15320 [Hyphomicrobiales bacterium]